MRLAALALASLWLAPMAAGDVEFVLPIAVSPTVQVPVELEAGASGSTVLGASATSASTTRTGLPLFGSADVLHVLRGAASWDVHVRFVSATGFGALETVTITLVGSTSALQVAVTGNTPSQMEGTPITLAPASVDLSLLAAGSNLPGGSGVLSCMIVLVPTGSAAPVAEYPWTFTVT